MAKVKFLKATSVDVTPVINCVAAPCPSPARRVVQFKAGQIEYALMPDGGDKINITKFGPKANVPLSYVEILDYTDDPKLAEQKLLQLANNPTLAQKPINGSGAIVNPGNGGIVPEPVPTPESNSAVAPTTLFTQKNILIGLAVIVVGYLVIRR